MSQAPPWIAPEVLDEVAESLSHTLPTGGDLEYTTICPETPSLFNHFKKFEYGYFNFEQEYPLGSASTRVSYEPSASTLYGREMPKELSPELLAEVQESLANVPAPEVPDEEEILVADKIYLENIGIIIKNPWLNMPTLQSASYPPQQQGPIILPTDDGKPLQTQIETEYLNSIVSFIKGQMIENGFYLINGQDKPKKGRRGNQ